MSAIHFIVEKIFVPVVTVPAVVAIFAALAWPFSLAGEYLYYLKFAEFPGSICNALWSLDGANRHTLTSFCLPQTSWAGFNSAWASLLTDTHISTAFLTVALYAGGFVALTVFAMILLAAVLRS